MSKNLCHHALLALLGGLPALAQALSLGAPQGLPQLWQPVELRVPVTLDPGLGVADLCPRASLGYGDRPVRPGVSPRADPVVPATAWLHLQASEPLDEPFVVVEVTVGCAQRLTRRDLLLAEVALGGAPAPVRRSTALESPDPTETAAAPAAGSPLSPSAAGPLPATAPPRLSVPRSGVPVSASLSPRPASLPAPGQLSLVTRRPTASEAAPATVEPLAGAGTGASDDAAVQDLRGQVATLQASLSSSQQALEDLRHRLQSSGPAPERTPWLAVAVAMAATGWGVSGLLWWRRRRSVRLASAGSRRPPRAARLATRSLAPAPGPAAPAAPLAGRASAAVPTYGLSGQGAPDHESGGREPTFQGASPGESELPDGRSQDPNLGDATALRMQEVSDVRQEAAFFVSLGEVHRAIALLRAQVASEAGASHPIWMDLLRLLYRSGRQEDYRQARVEFERWVRSQPREPALSMAPQPAGPAHQTSGLDLGRVLGQLVPAREPDAVDALQDEAAIPGGPGSPTPRAHRPPAQDAPSAPAIMRGLDLSDEPAARRG